MDDRSCKGKKLTLSRREVVASLTYYLVKAALELIDKGICVDVAAGFHNLIVGKGILTKDDIALDGAREKEYVLKHLSEMLA